MSHFKLEAKLKSTNKERMIENLYVFDFLLSKQDASILATLENKEFLFLSHFDPESVRFILNYDKTMRL
jgi:Aldo/keto reductases, related to diketogulonate reductase